MVSDLSARKGENELNAAYDFKKMKNYNENVFLVEYEFEPINRLDLEIEADYSFLIRRKTTEKFQIINWKIYDSQPNILFLFLLS